MSLFLAGGAWAIIADLDISQLRARRHTDPYAHTLG